MGTSAKFATRNGRGLSQPNEAAEEDGECIHSGRAIRRNLLCQGDPERKNEKHNTWEPVENLPTEMVEAFRNRQKKQTKQTKKGLNDLLLKEIDRRAKFSTKSRTERGTFAKKDVQDLSWKNYVRFFFAQHPGFKSTCQCGKSYEKAESFLTHLGQMVMRVCVADTPRIPAGALISSASVTFPHFDK